MEVVGKFFFVTFLILSTILPTCITFSFRKFEKTSLDLSLGENTSVSVTENMRSALQCGVHCRGNCFGFGINLLEGTCVIFKVPSLGSTGNGPHSYLGFQYYLQAGLPTDCAEVIGQGPGEHLLNIGGNIIAGYCDVDETGEGWLLFQRRLDGSVNFYRNWAEYKSGFGDLRGEFWYGNDKLHLLTTSGNYKLRIELVDGADSRVVQYDSFRIGNESDKYKLGVGGFKDMIGNAGDSFLYQNSMDFSTFDKDNDMKESASCAQMCTAAWWYNACRHSNLNGVYGSNTIGGIIWSSWKGHSYSLSASKMLIKKI